MNKNVNWLEFKFGVHQHEDVWSSLGGIYIFCGLNIQRAWYPFYIGQAASFRDRLQSHEQWLPAKKLGATHVHAMAVPNKNQRDEIEKKLIQAFKPSLNTQLK
jgi:excinuclease UvrABC nuclease subunit